MWIRIVQGCKLKIYSQKVKLIATHNLSGAKNQIIINPSHYDGLKRKKISDKDLLMKMFKKNFPYKVAFFSYRDGNWEIYVMNADSSKQTRLTNNPADDFGPFWSPEVN